jgi:ABC-type branched-subunit amino acid transport system substrate-binding protein
MLYRVFPAALFFVATVAAYSTPYRLSQPVDSVQFRIEAERLFDEGMAHFQSARYELALERFVRILRESPGSQRETAALIMGAKTSYILGKYADAERFIDRLLREHPGSRYTDDAHYTRALCRFDSGEYAAAARTLLVLFRASTDGLVRQRADTLFFALARHYLSLDALHALISDVEDGDVRVRLTVTLAERSLSAGDVQGARRLLTPLLSLPRSAATAAAAQLLEAIESSGMVKVGVVLPLMMQGGPAAVRDLGSELLEGIRLAMDEHNATALPKVNLVVRDSERDVGKAMRHVSELGSDQSVVALVGPVFSNEVQASAGIANELRLPLITPTATADGLASIGEYIFQANPDYSVRARAVAQFAALRRNARRFAILAPTDTAGRSMVTSFEDEVRELGGEMVDIQWYKPGESDLRVQLGAMRQKGLERMEVYAVGFSSRMRQADIDKLLRWGIGRPTIDSLIQANANAPVEALFGTNGKAIADSLKLPVQRMRMRYDSLGLAVTSIDAVFLPIASPVEIGIVSSHLRYFNFKAQLLGTGNWNDLNELEQNRQYTNGVIFTTDAYWEENDPSYQSFRRAYLVSAGKQPTVNAMIGYDAMNLLLKVIQQGATKRNEIASALASVRRFEGVRSVIAMGPSRVNSFLTLLQYRNRAIRKIGEIDVRKKEIVSFE